MTCYLNKNYKGIKIHLGFGTCPQSFNSNVIFGNSPRLIYSNEHSIPCLKLTWYSTIIQVWDTAEEDVRMGSASPCLKCRHSSLCFARDFSDWNFAEQGQSRIIPWWILRCVVLSLLTWNPNPQAPQMNFGRCSWRSLVCASKLPLCLKLPPHLSHINSLSGKWDAWWAFILLKPKEIFVTSVNRIYNGSPEPEWIPELPANITRHSLAK